jgi:hypothetical protein
MSSSPSSPPTPDTSSAVVVMKILEWIGRVVAPTTLGVALLVYFGWVRTTTFYSVLGIHWGVLALTSQDFVLSSITVVIDFFKWGLIALLAIVWIHYGLLALLRWQKRWRGALVFVIGVIGLGLLWASYNLAALDSVRRNLIWTAGVGLTSYSLWLAGSLSRGRSSTETLASQAAQMWPAFRSLNRLFIAGLLIVGLFVTVAWDAEAEGRRSAQAILNCPAQQPSATVYSQDPLTLETSGVTTTKISDEAQAYRYRYTGLRFLIHSNQKYFLIPEVLSSTVPSTIILPDNSAIRVELSPGAPCRTP